MAVTLPYVNIARIVAVGLIVAYHCLCYYTKRLPYAECEILGYDMAAGVVYYIGMSLFLLIAGFLYSHLKSSGRYGNYSVLVIKKWHRLLAPAIVWSLLFFYFTGGSGSVLSCLSSGYRHLWFLYMLTWLYLVAPVMYCFVTKANAKCLVCMQFGLLILAVVVECKCASWFQLGQIVTALVWAPTFFAGMTLNARNISFPVRDDSVNLMILFLLLACQVVACYFKGPIGLLFQRGVAIIFCGYLMMMLSDICHFASERSLIWIEHVSGYCMGIFVFHHVVLDLVLLNREIRGLFNEHSIIAPHCGVCCGAWIESDINVGY